MPYNLRIPGQVSEFQLKAIEAVASLVPRNGCVVEVGSLFGRSSWAWAKSVDPSVTVHCVDPWAGNEGVRSMEAQHGIRYGIEQFKEYTSDCPNIRPVQGFSPKDVEGWSTPVDVYYEDAVHTNPILAQNITFWTSRLTTTGIACGDDYRPRFADVRAAAHALADKAGRKLWIVDCFWCVLPDEARVPAAAGVAKCLADLAVVADKWKADSISDVRIGIGIVGSFPTTVNADEPLSIRLRVENSGLAAWPEVPRGALELRKRVYQGDRIILEETIPLGCRQLEYDMPVDKLLSLEIRNIHRGEVTLEFSLEGHSAKLTKTVAIV